MGTECHPRIILDIQPLKSAKSIRGWTVQQSRLTPFHMIYSRRFRTKKMVIDRRRRKLTATECCPQVENLAPCSGTAELSQSLSQCQYRVTAIDNSKAMLDLAQADRPDIKFQQFDIQHVGTSDNFDAVISAYNSLAQITAAADFLTVLANVRKCLNPQGFFLFD